MSRPSKKTGAQDLLLTREDYQNRLGYLREFFPDTFIPDFMMGLLDILKEHKSETSHQKLLESQLKQTELANALFFQQAVMKYQAEMIKHEEEKRTFDDVSLHSEASATKSTPKKSTKSDKSEPEPIDYEFQHEFGILAPSPPQEPIPPIYRLISAEEVDAGLKELTVDLGYKTVMSEDQMRSARIAAKVSEFDVIYIAAYQIAKQEAQGKAKWIGGKTTPLGSAIHTFLSDYSAPELAKHIKHRNNTASTLTSVLGEWQRLLDYEAEKHQLALGELKGEISTIGQNLSEMREQNRELNETICGLNQTILNMTLNTSAMFSTSMLLPDESMERSRSSISRDSTLFKNQKYAKEVNKYLRGPEKDEARVKCIAAIESALKLEDPSHPDPALTELLTTLLTPSDNPEQKEDKTIDDWLEANPETAKRVPALNTHLITTTLLPLRIESEKGKEHYFHLLANCFQKGLIGPTNLTLRDHFNNLRPSKQKTAEKTEETEETESSQRSSVPPFILKKQF